MAEGEGFPCPGVFAWLSLHAWKSPAYEAGSELSQQCSGDLMSNLTVR